MIRNPGSLPGEIQFKKDGYPDQTKCKCLLYHRVIESFYETDFDQGIVNADPNQNFFLDSRSLNNKQLTDVANATADDHAVNLAQLKSYKIVTKIIIICNLVLHFIKTLVTRHN